MLLRVMDELQGSFASPETVADVSLGAIVLIRVFKAIASQRVKDTRLDGLACRCPAGVLQAAAAPAPVQPISLSPQDRSEDGAGVRRPKCLSPKGVFFLNVYQKTKT